MCDARAGGGDRAVHQRSADRLRGRQHFHGRADEGQGQGEGTSLVTAQH